MIESGVVAPPIGGTYPLERAGEAVARLGDRSVLGKVRHRALTGAPSFVGDLPPPYGRAVAGTRPSALDPALVDLVAVGRWMDGQGLPAGEFERGRAARRRHPERAACASSRGGRTYVLRRGPRHLRPDEQRRDAARDAGAGARSPAPTCRTRASSPACPDEDVMGGAVFYLMESVDGFNPTVELPGAPRRRPGVRHEMGLAVGRRRRRARRGRPRGRRARRPRASPRGSSSARCRAGSRARVLLAPRRLPRARTSRASTTSPAGSTANRPRDFTPGIMHGDYHLANLLYRYDGPRGRRDRRLGDVHRRRPAARPRLAPRHLAGDRRAAGVGGGARRRSAACRPPTSSSPATPSGSTRDLSAHRLVRGAGLLQARHRARGHPRPRLRRQGARGGRRPAPRHDARPLRPSAAPHPRRLSPMPEPALPLLDKVALVTGGSRGWAARWSWPSPTPAPTWSSPAASSTPARRSPPRSSSATGPRRRSPWPANVGDWDDCDALVAAVLRALRPRRRAGEQRRHVAALPVARRGQRGALRQGDRRQPQGPVPADRLVGTRMAAGDGGSIINISSIAAVRPTPDRPALRRGQGRPERADRRVRPRLRPTVRVNASVRPVPHRHLRGLGPRRRSTRRARHVALAARRRARGRSSAPPCTWPRDASAYCTGATLRLDGGHR